MGAEDPFSIQANQADMDVEAQLAGEDDKRPLFPDSKSHDKPEASKGAGIFGTVFNLTNCIVGAGSLTLPYACRCTGIISFFIILLFVILVADYTFHLLILCGKHRNVHTYKELAAEAFNRKLAPIAEIVLWVYTLGTLIAYVVIIGDYLTAIMGLWTNSFVSQRWFVVLVMCVCVYTPLSLMKNLDPLRYTSLLAILFVTYVSIVILIRLAKPAFFLPVPKEKAAIVLFNWNIGDLFAAFPLMGVAFTAHYNIQRFYKELRARTMRRMTVVIHAALVICFMLYSVMALLGYLTFRQDTKDNILKNYGKKDPLAIIARIGMTITISLSFPLVNFANRQALLNIFFPGKPFHWLRHILFTLGIVALVTTIGILLPRVGIVLQFSGSLAGSCVIYIFPALFAMRLLPRKHLVPSILVLILGVTIMALGVRSAVLKAIAAGKKH